MLVPVLVLERRHAIVRPRQVESSGFVFRIRRVELAVVNGVVVVSSAQRDVRSCWWFGETCAVALVGCALVARNASLPAVSARVSIM